MTGTLRSLAATALVAACAGGAPAPDASSAAAAPAAADTVRGRLEATASEPAPVFVVTAADGGVTTLEGDRAILRRVVGLEVMVAGERDGGALRVDALAVRAADGVSAVDGMLAVDDGRDVLVTAEGRRIAVPHLPPPLRGRAGARVWLAGPLDRMPEAYGVIAEAP